MLADERTTFVFHDGWILGVPEAVEAAKDRASSCLWLPTSCEMILGTRSPERFAQLQKMFPEGEIEHRHPPYVLGVLQALKAEISIRFARISE